MPPLHHLLLLLALLLALLLGVGWWRSARRGGLRSRARNARAQGGEHQAEALLRAHGFRVIDRQVRRSGTMWVDGQACAFEVRVDLLVEGEEGLFVAEVKTGSQAPDPLHPATRRQLYDYWRLFNECGLLLVDVEAGQVSEIAFDLS